MADRNDEDILRAILEKGGDRAKKQAAALLAQQPNTPDTHVEVKEAKAKKRRKGLGAVIGKIGNSKFYNNAEGNAVDQDGNILGDRLAAALAKSTGEEKKAAVQQAIASPTNNADANAERKISGELSRVVKTTSNLTKTQGKMLTTIPNAFSEVEKIIANLVMQHEKIVSEIIKQNDDLRDKVIESLTGVKTPTKAGGARTKPSKAVGASKASKVTQMKSAIFKKTERDTKDAEQKKDVAKQTPYDAKLKSTAKEMGLFAIAGAAAGALASASGIGGRTPAGAGGPGGAGAAAYNGPGVAATGSAKETIDFFEKKGFTRAQAIGIAANIEAESKFKTNAEGDNGKAYGIAQWHPDRQAIFQKTYGKPIRESSFQEQLEFINWEFNNNEKEAAGFIRQAQDAGQAAAYVDQYYERSSGAHRQKRIEIAQRYAKGEGLATPAVAGGAAATATPTTPGADGSTPTGTPGAPTTADASAPGAPGAGGGGNVREAQSGASIRKMPISPGLKGVLQQAASVAGVDVVVTSGGQPAFPKGPRTGSTRHDLGNAADLDLYVGGRILSDANPADIELKKKFVAAATAAGASGVGAGASYMGLTKIHVGFGDPAKWGGAAWIQGIRTGSGRPSATSTQMQAGNALSSASQQNAAAQMRQNQGPVTYNNNRVVNTETTVYQTASVSLRKMEQAFNPYNMLANAVTGRPLF
jgi:hypothetical protein